jgi:hypothetical protein
MRIHFITQQYPSLKSAPNKPAPTFGELDEWTRRNIDQDLDEELREELKEERRRGRN